MAIGTDGPASNNCLDMFREMFLTSALAKVREMDAECVSADEILYMATTGGAHAMQLFDCDLSLIHIWILWCFRLWRMSMRGSAL